LANELVASGKYNISPFKITTPAETSNPKQHEVAVKLFQESAQGFDFKQYMKFKRIENERLESIRKVERDQREKIRLAEIKLTKIENERLENIRKVEREENNKTS